LGQVSDNSFLYFKPVAVTLVVNGNTELPTEKQQKALGVLLLALCKKLSIVPSMNFAEGHGFHSDYNTLKKCPGDLISKQMVLKWMEEASH
jgi:hypothetical protein